MDRPSRKTKVVSYCEAKDFDDDEDFACVKAPPSKKAREDVRHQEHKKSTNKRPSQETMSQPTLSQKSRMPLDHKFYDRDLEAAITLSLLNNSEGIKDQSPTTKGDVMVQLPVDENTDPSLLHLSNCSVDGATLGLYEITSEKMLPAPTKQRKVATEEQRKKLKEDEDYKPKLTPDSESDEDFSEPDASEDEEFTVKKVTKSKRKEKVPKKEKTKSPPLSKKEKQPPKSKSQAAVASTPVRSPSTAKLAPKRPASSPTVPASKPTFSTSKPAIPLSPAGGRIPKWNPPGQVGKSPTTSQNSSVKSPGQGLRLGLSRLVRVKPLHPSVASH